MSLEVEVVGAAPVSAAPSPKRTQELVAAAVTARGVGDGHVAVSYVDAARMAQLNAEHRGREGPTDVLSFPIDADEVNVAGPRELGDIVICASETTDLEEAIVHGALHLVGMDHETDGGEMLALQDQLMARLR
jgi:probable rRNA maturation factor